MADHVTDADLQDWYHTVDLGNGVRTRGIYDHAPVLDCYQIPDRLDGLRVLDVGTANGFFAFEMESRGAAEVIAVDVPDLADFDWLPRLKGATRGNAIQRQFELARTLKRSHVQRRYLSVYDVGPPALGSFDLVFCGSLLLHLQNPWLALANLLSVCRDRLIVETFIDVELETEHPTKPWLRVGHREYEQELGTSCIYWRFSTTALLEMLEYVGFAAATVGPSFALPPTMVSVRAVTAHVRQKAGATEFVNMAPGVPDWRHIPTAGLGNGRE
jgi:SAM-dependent methyltransferase